MNNIFQWILASIFGISSIIIFILSLYFGKTKKINGIGNINLNIFEDQLEYLNNFSIFLNSTLINLKIFTHSFSLPSKNSLIYNSFKSLINKKIKIDIICNKINLSDDFFDSNLVNYYLCDLDKFPGGIINDFIISDFNYIIFSSISFNNFDLFLKKPLNLFINNSKVLSNDFNNFFELIKCSLNKNTINKLPPYSRFWPYEYLPQTNYFNQNILKDGSSIYLTQSNSTLVPPERDIILTSLSHLINSTISPKLIYISASKFFTTNSFEFYNLLISAAFKGSKIQILLDNNEELNNSLNFISNIIGIDNIFINICPIQYYLSDYIIFDNNFYFQSNTITGKTFNNSLGIGIVIKNPIFLNLTKNYFENYLNLCNNNFTLHANQIY